MKTGLELIAEERQRQITAEGYTAAHDDEHVCGELIDAGLSHIHGAINYGHPAMQRPPLAWPWDKNQWKPNTDRIRNLVKAGALLAAEIDRLQRFASVNTPSIAPQPGFDHDERASR